MKTRILIAGLVALFASILFTGCATGGPVNDSALIQKVLDQVVPPSFEGDLRVDHTGHYFGTTVSFNVDLKGLRKEGDQWKWDAGGYTRSGVFSNGGITLTPRAK